MDTWAKYQGKLVQIVNVSWPKSVFDYLQKQYPKAWVAIEDRYGQRYTVKFGDLEWREP